MQRKITKKLIIVFLTLSMTLLLASCDKNKNKQETLNNSIALVYKNNTPYLINEKLEKLSLEQYDLIVPFFDEILIVKKNNKFGYIKNNGETLIEPQFDEAYPFSDGKAVVRKGSSSYIINEENKTLFELNPGITSIGYFIEDFLVISDNSSQGYLKYDKDTNSFSYLFDTPSNVKYEYCGRFNNGYAVIGFRNENGQFRYSHIDKSGNRLYDLDWEYANDFSDGYAVVGNMSTIKAYGFDTISGSLTGETRIVPSMVYNYISPTGDYLEAINPETRNKEICYFAHANSFKDNTAVVSKIYFIRLNGQINYFNNYRLINSTGNEIAQKASLQKNYFGNGRILFYDDVFKFDEYYILSINSIACSNYFIKQSDIEKEIQDFNYYIIDAQEKASLGQRVPEYQPLYTKYSDVSVKIPTTTPDGQLVKWIQDYIKEYTLDKYTEVYVVDHTSVFYYQTLFKKSKFYNSNLIAKVQTSSGIKDSCGLISLSIGEKGPYISYVIPPLFDDVIF